MRYAHNQNTLRDHYQTRFSFFLLNSKTNNRNEKKHTQHAIHTHAHTHTHTHTRTHTHTHTHTIHTHTHHTHTHTYIYTHACTHKHIKHSNGKNINREKHSRLQLGIIDLGFDTQLVELLQAVRVQQVVLGNPKDLRETLVKFEHQFRVELCGGKRHQLMDILDNFVRLHTHTHTRGGRKKQSPPAQSAPKRLSFCSNINSAKRADFMSVVANYSAWVFQGSANTQALFVFNTSILFSLAKENSVSLSSGQTNRIPPEDSFCIRHLKAKCPCSVERDTKRAAPWDARQKTSRIKIRRSCMHPQQCFPRSKFLHGAPFERPFDVIIPDKNTLEATRSVL